MYFIPLSAESFTMASQSSTEVAMGTVQATCLPARMACRVASA